MILNIYKKMNIGPNTTQTVSALFAPIAIGFIQSSLSVMIPWMMVMFLVIIVDLIAGLRKSLKLGIHVSISSAIRNTMGKMVTYFAFVCMVCMVDVAASGCNIIAKWSCLFVCAIEGVSIFGNFLKPYGIDLSLKSIIEVFAKRLYGLSSADLEKVAKSERIEVIRKREEMKWNKKK